MKIGVYSYFHALIHFLNTLHIIIFINELISYRFLLEKMLTTFFTMSYSILTSLNSFIYAFNSCSSDIKTFFLEKFTDLEVNFIRHLPIISEFKLCSSPLCLGLPPSFNSITISTLN
jgi:hypothetical protein